MTTPAEVLELVAEGESRWQTVEQEGRSHEDRLAARSAAVEALGARVAVRVRSSRGSGTVADGRREQSFHLWRGGGSSVRSEYSIGRELVTVVSQGSRWWRWSPTLGPTSGAGVGRPARLMLGPAGVLLDARGLLEQLEFDQVRSTTAAGRAALALRGVPVASRPKGRAALREAGPGADAYDVTLDAEYGVLLGVAALRNGSAFQSIETTRIVFDRTLPTALFSPDAAPTTHFAAARAAQHLSAEGLIDAVDFAVLIPNPSPSSVEPHVAVFDGDRRGLGPQRAVLTYVVAEQDTGRGQLRITESSAELPRAVSDEWLAVGDLEVCEELHGKVLRRRIRAQRLGTYVELESTTLPPPRLIEILGSLVPFDGGGG